MKSRQLLLLAFLLPLPALAAEDVLSPEVASARDAVLRQLGTAAVSATLDVVSAGRAESIGEGITYKAHAVPGRFPRARFTVMVDVLRHGRVIATHPVGFALSQRGSALVYRHAEHAGVAAELLDTAVGDVDTARSMDALQDLAGESGMRLRHAVREGAPVLASDFEPVPDVDNRSVVRLQATYGAITVESPAVAMRSGNRGDKVPVMVSGATGPVTALVVDKGVTRIEQ